MAAWAASCASRRIARAARRSPAARRRAPSSVRRAGVFEPSVAGREMRRGRFEAAGWPARGERQRAHAGGVAERPPGSPAGGERRIGLGFGDGLVGRGRRARGPRPAAGCHGGSTRRRTRPRCDRTTSARSSIARDGSPWASRRRPRLPSAAVRRMLGAIGAEQAGRVEQLLGLDEATLLGEHHHQPGRRETSRRSRLRPRSRRALRARTGPGRRAGRRSVPAARAPRDQVGLRHLLGVGAKGVHRALGVVERVGVDQASRPRRRSGCRRRSRRDSRGGAAAPSSSRAPSTGSRGVSPRISRDATITSRSPGVPPVARAASAAIDPLRVLHARGR